MFYAVLTTSLIELYCGQSSRIAAQHLVPGTVYGSGPEPEHARHQAAERAREARRAERKEQLA